MACFCFACALWSETSEKPAKKMMTGTLIWKRMAKLGDLKNDISA
jgi:hypothetical protein